jgi:hypothetical protein
MQKFVRANPASMLFELCNNSTAKSDSNPAIGRKIVEEDLRN